MSRPRSLRQLVAEVEAYAVNAEYALSVAASSANYDKARAASYRAREASIRVMQVMRAVTRSLDAKIARKRLSPADSALGLAARAAEERAQAAERLASEAGKKLAPAWRRH